MRRALLTVTCGAVFLLLHPPAANAMGFGRTLTATTLGQPLNFFATLALDADESLGRECVAADVMFGDSKIAPENVRVTLETARDSDERRVRVTTRIGVDEPIVTITVTVGCTSQVSRRFVAFVDPPLIHLANAETEALPPQRVDNQVRPLLDIVRAADASQRPSARRDDAASRSAAREERPARRRMARVAPTAVPVAVASAPLRQARDSSAPVQRLPGAPYGTAPAATATPRLRLDAATGLAAASTPRAATPTPAPAADTSLAAAEATASAGSVQAALAAVASASAALGRERDRLQALESGLARLRADSAVQQKTMLELQARLRQAESDRYANGLVYALSAGLIFFALLAAAFWALRPRQRSRARWFDEAAKRERRAREVGGRAEPASVASTETVRTPAVSQQPSQWSEESPGIAVTAPATIGGLEVTTVLAPQSHYERMSEAAASANAVTPGEVTRPMSSPIEELIDLEQQAEFFVVLGQDEAAIALLAAHMGDHGSASPLPYMQLLEIHQRRGDRDAYEEVRRGFQRNFQAFAPEWSSDLHFGRSLEEYPQAIARVQALWSTPLHAMQSLDGLLFRRNEADEAFDFPAYRDLLFLYSVARELAGNVETDFGSIDLFLPLDDSDTQPVNARHEGTFAVDLDVTDWPANEPVEGLVIQRSVGRRSAG